MDILGGLGVVGSYMGGRSFVRETKVNTHRIKRTPINGNDTYNARNYRLDKHYQDMIANNRYIQARDPMKTGIIPNFYNQMQVVQEREKCTREEIVKKTCAHRIAQLINKQNKDYLEVPETSKEIVYSTADVGKIKHAKSNKDISAGLEVAALHPYAINSSENLNKKGRTLKEKFIDLMNEEKTNTLFTNLPTNKASFIIFFMILTMIMI
jgi:hypothetical protein